MKLGKQHPFGSTIEAVIYPLLLIVLLWAIQWMQTIIHYDFYKWGMLPRTVSGLKGIVFMPLLHSRHDIHHIINNSLALFVLLALLIYYYHDIAFKVFVLIWLLTGLLVWGYAVDKGVYHIGISGVIYGLVGFLFTSGVLRKYLPLQAISLLVVFAYGNLIWGILPVQPSVSWEGHFMGLVAGLILAFVFRSQSIQAPKYQYEIEKELGIEPPDLERIWNEKQEEALKQQHEQQSMVENPPVKIIYHYIQADKLITSTETSKEESFNSTISKSDKNDL
ncbi:MAG: rhomboid family intramembrane serine protease [Crocinitomicaceae bacterium]|nr:rhomboid family intramembrane serine protease [Crocinitomicaceae bacterium]